MSYRNDRDADEARIAALEAELAETKRRLAEVEGRRDQALVLASTTALERGGSDKRASQERWFGAPLELALAKDFTGSFPAEKFEDVIDRLRTITRDPGRSEILRSSLTWSTTAREKSTGPFNVITVSSRDGVTKVLATDRLSQLAGGVYAGIGGSGAMVAVYATIAVPVLAPIFLLASLGGGYWGSRALYKRAARRRAQRLQLLFDAACDEVARGI